MESCLWLGGEAEAEVSASYLGSTVGAVGWVTGPSVVPVWGSSESLLELCEPPDGL